MKIVYWFMGIWIMLGFANMMWQQFMVIDGGF